MEPVDNTHRNESIVRFAHDMAKARSGRGMSLQSLHESTKIPRGLLEEFEKTGLVENPLFNRVYLRSFISTYARTIGLDRDRALQSLESALAGTYVEGSFSVRGAGPDAEAGEAQRGQGPDKAEAEGVLERQRDVPDTGVASGESVAGETSTFTQPTRKRQRPYKPGVARRFRFEPIRPERPRKSRNDIQGDQFERTEISTTVTDYKEPAPQRGLIIPPNRVKAAIFIVLAVGITVSAAIVAFQLSRNAPRVGESSTSTSEREAGAQTGAVEPRPLDPPARAIPSIIIGDTLRLTVSAPGRPLDPIRIKVDRDLRRPFWIDTGDSMTFRFVDRVVLDSLLDRATVTLESVRYWPISGQVRNRLVITRDSVEHFAASLRSR